MKIPVISSEKIQSLREAHKNQLLVLLNDRVERLSLDYSSRPADIPLTAHEATPLHQVAVIEATPAQVQFPKGVQQELHTLLQGEDQLETD